MSSLSGPFYRAAGMSYLRYSNICADLLRAVLKEPHKSKAAARAAIHYRYAPFADGKQGPAVYVDIQNMPVKASAEAMTSK